MSNSESAPAPPLKPNVFLILLALSDGQAHGYQIRGVVERRSGGSVVLDPGTLYRHIGRLLEEGLIEESDERPDDDDPRRRYYQLSADGVVALESEAQRMAALVGAVRRSKLVGSTSGAR